MAKKKGITKAEPPPELDPSSDEQSVVDSDDYSERSKNDDLEEDYVLDDEDDSDDEVDSAEDKEGFGSDGDDDNDSVGGEFEDQGSSDDEEDALERQKADDDSSEGDVEILDEIEDYEAPRAWRKQNVKRTLGGSAKEKPSSEATWIHTDDLSSDDEDAEGLTNRIGRVPLHWYDEYEHIGYDAHGGKVTKSTGKGDRLDQAIAGIDGVRKFIVHDALNDKEVELSERQLELIRRVQAGAYAHPEFDANPDYIDYFSGVDREISGLSSGRIEPKSKWQPNAFEALQVRKILQDLKEGKITIDDLKGKTKKDDQHQAFLLWKGDEEDELAMRKGPQHLPAPKVLPPGHAESYIPPDEYLPTAKDLEDWAEMPVKDRPHGHLIPRKFPNLRSLGAYQHAVQEAFDRCLDLYLCPRSMKRRLNIDPETLVPKLPNAQDLRPFPTAKCIEYETPFKDNLPPSIRCLSPSPDGQYLVSGASDGFVRLWEVQTSRLLKSWDVNRMVAEFGNDRSEQEGQKPLPVVAIEWNPNKLHQCLVAAAGTCVVIISTGTGNSDQSTVTESLFAAARKGGNVTNAKAAKVVVWKPVSKVDNEPVSSCAVSTGPVAVLVTSKEVASVRWHKKGDYFVSVSPKAAAAAVLIHQLSKGNSQQPFSKSKGEAQLACFHPNKPFLFVASPQHVRVYHLVKQSMVKRLISGCRWISSLDVHPTGDHLIIGTLDRRMIWFDLDLSNTPYKTLKYHERGLRSVGYHSKYPLMASASDDGSVHIFHSMVYSDLMRNPLVVPVKVLRGHSISNNLGVLTLAFHPSQPWIFTGGADGQIFLYQDI